MNQLSARLLLAVLVVLAGCSSPTGSPAATTDGAAGAAASEPAAADGGDEGAPAGDFDLCTALTIDEINAATGAEATVTDGVSLGEGQYSCNYNADATTPVAGHTFTTPDAGIDPGQMFDANATDGERVSGIGDDAVMAGDDDFPMLWVRVGDSLYALTVLADNLDGDGRRAAMEELARIAVGRLP